MDLLSISLGIAAVLGALCLKFAASEIQDWLPTIALRLVDSAILRLPASLRDRYREEWRAHLSECPGRFGKLWHALGCWLGAGAVANAVDKTSPSGEWLAVSVLNRLSFRTTLLDVITRLEAAALQDPIYYTAQFELFVLADALDRNLEKLKALNENIFEKLAIIGLRADGPGLRLIVHYDEAESESFEIELDAIREIIRRAAAKNKIELDCKKFSVRRIPRKLTGRYYVVDRHLFKVQTKNGDPNDSRYIHVTSSVLAEQYRAWLADMFATADDNIRLL